MDEEAKVAEKIRNQLSSVKHKIIILSGKGGVGKSTVTANLAAILAKKNQLVGIFDYDFHGPAIPKMLGVPGKKLVSSTSGFLPVIAVLGIKVISIAFLLPDEKTPVIWRGPLKYKALIEFLTYTDWGRLDYLLFDLPPGTGDEALNIAKMIPEVDGAIVVTIPSDVSRIAVEKSAEFCKSLNIRLLGVIENMSYFKCPNCGAEYDIFGRKAAEKISLDEGIPLLGEIPLDPNISKSMDQGEPIILRYPDSPASKEFERIAEKVIELLK